MAKTRWWKCDLQVGTPAWHFTLPAGCSHDFGVPDDRRRFADQYMQAVRAKGIEVIALAAHNTHDWIDEMKAAGERNGVFVFPGCEITTGTGADGVHLLIIGDCSATARDIDQLLAGQLGFPDEQARFTANRQPRPSQKTLAQILDDLAESYLVIAPHALTENGIASGNTIQGLGRIDVMGHPRLAAVDPGDCSDLTGDSFADRFRRRELDTLPRLKDLAFVATSDAYSLDELGNRHTWIRMAEPSLEGLRQAFIDREARILCDWDRRLGGYPERDPNHILHAWIQSVDLRGAFGDPAALLHVEFHPGINAIIGARGSGKSTIVAAIRQLYASQASMPEMVKAEAERFAEEVLGEARLAAVHNLATSQESRAAAWSRAEGSRTATGSGDLVRTSFPVRVVNQRELFERITQYKNDPHSASRSLLAFVDENLNLHRTDPLPPDSWWRKLDDARTTWISRVEALQTLENDLSQIPALQARVTELQGQIAAMDTPEARDLVARANNLRSRGREIQSTEAALEDWLRRLEELAGVDELPQVGPPVGPIAAGQSPAVASTEEEPALGHEAGFAQLLGVLTSLHRGVRNRARSLAAEGRAALHDWRESRATSAWAATMNATEAEFQSYVQSLQARGVNPDDYDRLRRELAEARDLLAQVEARRPDVERARLVTSEAWASLLAVVQERRQARQRLLDDISRRSGTLRFGTVRWADTVGWVTRVRTLLNIRADGFLEDFPKLANWLWSDGEAPEQARRWGIWRSSLISGGPAMLQSETSLRGPFLDRLGGLDMGLRLRLAAEMADDVVTMEFLREGGRSDRGDDWQPATRGSPGQRTAAMLAFVLHHGNEPLVLDQPEDDLDTELISSLVVAQLRQSRWKRQVIVVTHNANIPVNGDAEQVVVMENVGGTIRIRRSELAGADAQGDDVLHEGPIEIPRVREDIQRIMEGGIEAFKRREMRYSMTTR